MENNLVNACIPAFWGSRLYNILGPLAENKSRCNLSHVVVVCIEYTLISVFEAQLFFDVSVLPIMFQFN
jgi:hypothetical protein